MHPMDQPLWRDVWARVRARGGRMDLPAGLGLSPSPSLALGILDQDPRAVRRAGPDWTEAPFPILLALPGVLLFLPAGGRTTLSNAYGRRLGQGRGNGTLWHTPGAARLLRQRLQDQPSGRIPAVLRPLPSAHARAEAARRFGAAAVDRIEAIAALPHASADGPKVHRVQGLLLVEAATPNPASGVLGHHLLEAIPA